MKKTLFFITFIMALVLTGCSNASGIDDTGTEEVETRKGFVIDNPFTIEEAYEAKQTYDKNDSDERIYIEGDILESSADGLELIISNGGEKAYYKTTTRERPNSFVFGPNAMKGAKITIRAFLSVGISKVEEENKRVMESLYKISGEIIKVDKTNIATPNYEKCEYTFSSSGNVYAYPNDEHTENATDLEGYNLWLPDGDYANEEYSLRDNKYSGHTRYITKVVLTLWHELEKKNDRTVIYRTKNTDLWQTREVDSNWQIIFEFDRLSMVSELMFKTSYEKTTGDISLSTLYLLSFDLTPLAH